VSLKQQLECVGFKVAQTPAKYLHWAFQLAMIEVYDAVQPVRLHGDFFAGTIFFTSYFPIASHKMIRKFLPCLILIAGLVPVTTAQAQAIVFGPATTMSSDLDVSIEGDLVYGYTYAAAPVTVHTVSFSIARGGNNGVLFFAPSLDRGSSEIFNGNNTPPAGSTNASLSDEYRVLVMGAGFPSGEATTADVTLTALDAGDDYQVQIWLHDARNISSSNVATITSGPNSVNLAYNSEAAIPGGADSDNSGGVGQFVIGTFTATASSETFTLSVPAGQGGLQLNAIQVRNVSVPVILGDVNRDGSVDFLDIAPFIAVLASGEYQAEADINRCGVIDFLQISPFIQLLSRGS